MHKIQTKIMVFLQKTKITNIGLNQLGRFINEPHPQKMKYHLEKLSKEGYIFWSPDTGSVNVLRPIGLDDTKFINLKIVGAANCGAAGLIADERIEGYLKVSRSILGVNSPEELFVVEAVGNSLNDAKEIKGGEVEDGDYVVIDGSKRSPSDGDYVLSVIDGCANLKRFYRRGDQIVLMSESKSDIPPIYIHSEDFPDYMVNGTIVKVIKKPKI
jgi:SOS-response transcriptional repressor LexA